MMRPGLLLTACAASQAQSEDVAEASGTEEPGEMVALPQPAVDAVALLHHARRCWVS